MSQANIVEKIRKHVLCCHFYSENHAVYEIMWKNMVELESTYDNVIRHMRFACWITKNIYVYMHTHAHTQNI